MKNTTNYNLKKPDINEYVDINNINENMDIIDAVLAQKATYNQTYQGNPITIPNTKAGDYLLPSIKGYTKITKPNSNAEISPTNIATLQNVVNPVFTASDGKGNSTTAILQAELYSLPNGICDEYDGVSDKLIKNIINRELTGNENWLLESNYSSTDYPCFYASTKGDNCIDNSFVLCTHLKYNANFAVLNTDIGIAIKNNGNNVIKIYVKVNKEIASTSPAFSSWIRNQKLVGKPVKLSYQLATPIVTYPNIKLTAYDGTTTVSCNDAVLQDMSVTLADQRKVYGAVNADMFGGKSPNEYLTLGERTKIPANVDLNDYKTIGCFAAKNYTDVQTVINRPFDNAFNLDVGCPTGDNDGNYKSQTAIEYNTRRIKSRIFNPFSNGGTWGEWREYAMGETLTADKTIYVRKTGNDETGDGSTGNPFLTVGKAINYANRVNGNAALIIKIGNGIYEEYSIPALVSNSMRSVVIESESANFANVTIRIHNNNGKFWILGCNVIIRYLTFESVLDEHNGSIYLEFSKAIINDCKFIQTGGGSLNTASVWGGNMSNAVVVNCVFENTVFGIVSLDSTYISANNNTGNCRSIAYLAVSGTISATGSIPSAPTQSIERAGGIYKYS